MQHTYITKNFLLIEVFIGGHVDNLEDFKGGTTRC